MRVDLLDPPAYSPPYDDALAASLARAGGEVRLVTSAFAYGDTPAARGYSQARLFYRYARGPAGSRRRTATKLAQHVPDMLAYGRSAAAVADVAHFEWLTVPRLDLRLIPDIPTVLTVHDPLERGGSARLGQLLTQTCGARRYARIGPDSFKRVDAVIVHSQYARERVVEQHGLEPAKVHVIPHGALPYRSTSEAGTVRAASSLRQQGSGEPPASLPPELKDDGTPVVLCFGLLRPYKGVETLLRAWRGVSGAQLWIVGRSMMDVAPLRATAPDGVRIVPRFATLGEETALFGRADIVVLPYHRSDRFGFSGVLATALGYGKAIVVSDVGGLADVARPEPGDPSAGPAARLVPPDDADALHTALIELLTDPDARNGLAEAAATAAATTYSWDRIARQTLDLYATITA